MTDNGALQAMLDAFDNARQGLGIWDENDNLIGFNKIYADIFEKSLLIKPSLGINFKKAWNDVANMPETIHSKENIVVSCINVNPSFLIDILGKNETQIIVGTTPIEKKPKYLVKKI